MKQNRTHFLNNSTTTDRSRNKVAKARIPLLTKPMQRPTLSLQTPPAIIESCFKKKKTPDQTLTFEKFHLPQNRTGMEINKQNTEIQTKAKHTNKHKRRKCGLRKTHLIWSRVASSRRILESWSISVTSAGASWTAAMETEMAAAGKRADCAAMENATKEQTACRSRTSTKATKEKRDNKKGVQQQAGVALTWMKNITIGSDASIWMENSDRRMHPHR